MRIGENSESIGITPTGVLRGLVALGVARSRGRCRRQLHAQLGALGAGADHVVGVQDLDAVGELDVAGGDLALAVLVEAQHARLGVDAT